MPINKIRFCNKTSHFNLLIFFRNNNKNNLASLQKVKTQCKNPI